jgi:hypothetical protein
LGSLYTYDEVKDLSVFCLLGHTQIAEVCRSDLLRIENDIRDLILPNVEERFLNNYWQEDGALRDTVRTGTSPAPPIKEDSVPALLAQFSGMFSRQLPSYSRHDRYAGYDSVLETAPVKNYHFLPDVREAIHPNVKEKISYALAEGATKMVAIWLEYTPQQTTGKTVEELSVELANRVDNTARTIMMAAQVKQYWDVVQIAEKDPLELLKVRSAVSIFLHGVDVALHEKYQECQDDE